MAGLVITIAQRKGGAGKTTLAAQLAVAWVRQGARVAVLDIDPQGSLAAWVDLRRGRLGAHAIGFDFAALPGWRAAPWINDRARLTDIVVIDNPPHAETEAQIAVRAAGLVLIPVQPSPLDLWATGDAQNGAKRAEALAHRFEPGPSTLEHDRSDRRRPRDERADRSGTYRQPHRPGSGDGVRAGRGRKREHEPCGSRDCSARRRGSPGLKDANHG
jgi:hypothetical protein